MRWPAEMGRRGVLVTSYNEQIAFDGFMTSEHLLFLDRKAPDAVGARQVLIAYGNVVAVKITDVVKSQVYEGFGFEMPRAAKKPAP